MKFKRSSFIKKVGVLLCFVAFALSANAQTRKVTGQIVDESGQPIIGATIRLQDATTGTITDIDGHFSLNVPDGKKVVISYIGYLKQVILPKGDTLKVILQEDNQKLDEVVVVGYGSMKQKNITGSVSTISAEELEDLPVSNLSEALQGMVNGLNVQLGSSRPGTNANEVYIRQNRTFTGISKDGGNSTPLIIIDDVIQLGTNGQPSMEQFNMLDPSEVESITVLRDASAAIYGSRAANGAILVKTKRGKKGVPVISYSGKFAVNDAVSHSKVLKGSAYGRFYNALAIGSNKASGYDDLDVLYSDMELAEMDNLNYDWLDKAGWKSAFQQTHTLNVTGGSERATYYAGATYFDQGANLGDQSYKRYTYRAGVDVRLTNDIKLSATVAGNEGKSDQIYTKGARFKLYGMSGSTEKSDYSALHHMPNHMPWNVTLPDENGQDQEYWLGPIENTYSSPSFNRDYVTSWNYFALNNSGSFSKNRSNSWNADISLTYEVPFVKGLSLRATYSSSHSSEATEQASFPYELAYVGGRMPADQHLVYTIPSSSFKTAIFDKNSTLSFKDKQAERRQMNFYVNYDRTFGQHSISAMASIERYESFYDSRDIEYADLAHDISDTYLGVGGPSIVGPDGKSALASDNTVTLKGESGSLSYLGRVAYSYADRYMLQFIFRSDASTKFAPENYWGFFPGISAGWITSEESWFKRSLPWFEFLKVRASWGRTGRDNIKMWKWKEQYKMDLKGMQFGAESGKPGTSLIPQSSPNRNVKWDVSDKFNLGFDTRFFDGRLSAVFDFYYDINDNILNQFMASQPGIPVYAGGSYAEENFGRVDTYGGELSLTWRDKVGQVNYNIGMDFGLNGSRVKEWVPGLRYNKYPSSSSWEEGMSTYLPVWGFKVWKGTSNGDGILRTQDDINRYWSYLESYTPEGGQTKYLDKTSKDDLRPGMLAYQDLGGEMVNGVQQGPNGQIVLEQDYGKLCEKNKTYNVSTRLGASWKGLAISANIATSWGGVRFIDRASMGGNKSTMIWAPDSFWGDMFDEMYNPNGKYPNLGTESLISSSAIANSDFWMISTFRCYIRNLSVSYTLPKKWIAPLKMSAVRLNLTGNNLWDLYNPYPNHYRNMYDASSTDYPTLRTWSLGVNVTF